jgi:GGDEF domain-containing protein
MLSIRHSLDELEASDRARALALDCYVSAIRNTAQYAIELDDSLTGPHRKYLRALAAEVSSAKPDCLEDSRATFRGLLRDYRDKAARYISGLREELACSAGALQQILSSFCQADTDHEKRIRGALGRLHSIPSQADTGVLRAAMLDAAGVIEQSLEEIRKEHQVTISQFQVEIRNLHKRIDELESAAAIEDLTKLFTRRETEERVRAAPETGGCLLLIRARGLRVPAVATELSAAFARRLRNSLPSGTVVGRWSAEEFVALVPLGKPETIALGKKIAEQLSGAYACLQDGKTVRPTIQLGVAVVAGAGETAERLIERVQAFLTGE